MEKYSAEKKGEYFFHLLIFYRNKILQTDYCQLPTDSHQFRIIVIPSGVKILSG